MEYRFCCAGKHSTVVFAGLENGAYLFTRQYVIGKPPALAGFQAKVAVERPSQWAADFAKRETIRSTHGPESGCGISFSASKESGTGSASWWGDAAGGSWGQQRELNSRFSCRF